MAEFQPITPVSSLREGQGITIFHAGRNVALFKMGEEVLALDGICPHKGAPLGFGFVEDGRVACPMHGWRFDLRTGECFDHPCRTESFPARINGDMVEVAL